MTKILVTGGAGFIGSYTVDLLLKEGKDVLVLDNLASGKVNNLNLNHPNLEFVEGDVLEYPFLKELVEACDAVLHLAAVASVVQSIEYPIYTFQVNTQGLLHVLEALKEVNPEIRLVYASSASVYGEVETPPCSDEVPLTNQPCSPYALQKLHSEEYAALYKKQYGISSLGLRYFNVYGLRQDPFSPYSGVVSRFLSAYRADQTLLIFGDGKQSRDFIHVFDVAEANLLALESKESGVLNIGTGVPETLLNLISYIEEIAKKPADLRFLPPRPGDLKVSYATIEKAKKAIDFKAKIPLQEGISWLMENLDSL